MLDYKKLREDFTKILDSYTDEEVFEWVEMDRQRMALLEEEENRISQVAMRPNKSKLNGTPRAAKLNLEPVEA